MLAALSFIIVISVLVFVHELGHFLTAKLAGIRVQEFAMGFPPRILGIHRGETTYSINAIPLGGYVRMAGEEDPSVPGSLAGKKTWVRAIVLAAGAFNNLLLAVLLFAVVAMVPKQVQAGDVLVTDVFSSSPAAAAGIRAGDVVRRVNGQLIDNSGELQYQLQLHLGADTALAVERDGQTLETHVVPRWLPPEGQGATGIKVRLEHPQLIVKADSFFPALWHGAGRTVDTVVLVKNTLTRWVLGKLSNNPANGTDAPALSGPVGVAQLTGEVARLGMLPLIELAALLSLNLAVMNIMPLPALDGGRLLFVAVEVIRGKPIPARKEALVHMAGFVLLMTTMLIISYFDIMRIAHGGSLIGG